ncbi:MAG TPA: FG-GAP repeat protein, partial [Planctomycetota bacterium]|nr:FG-GAP repeat protein [Planctomycetota bacterium]
IDRTWTLVQVLVAPDPAAFDLFGGAFALTHDRIVVGVAAKDVSLESQQGEVYVWRFNGTAFELEQQLFASDGAAGDKFGTSVDIDADRIVVGAPGEDSHNDTDNGAMYVFRRVGGTWLERQKIRASDGESLDAFGTSVAVDGSLVIAGAPDADGPLLPGRGAAYVYQFGGAVFAEEVKLVPSNGLAGDAFGTTVDIDGGVAVVGAPRDDVGLLVDSGSVWLYRKGSDSWSGEAVWAPADISASAQYGAALAMDSGLVLVGAPSDAVGTSAVQGSACLAKTQPPDWNWIGHSLAGTQGAPDLVGSGSLETGSGIGLSIDDARGAAPVILCISAVQITLPFKGGVMVPAPDILLAGLPTDVWGALQLSGAWPGGVPSGLPIIWQAWVPDPSAGQGFSATNAITCTVP